MFPSEDLPGRSGTARVACSTSVHVLPSERKRRKLACCRRNEIRLHGNPEPIPNDEVSTALHGSRTAQRGELPSRPEGCDAIQQIPFRDCGLLLLLLLLLRVHGFGFLIVFEKAGPLLVGGEFLIGGENCV